MTDRELMQLAREKERADANEDDAKRWRNIKGYWRGVERELADAKERAERAEAELAALRERLAQPRQWQGLSTEEIYDMYNHPRSDAEMVEFARAVEAKFKEKNQ